MKQINITLLVALPFLAAIFYMDTNSIKLSCLLTAILYAIALLFCRIIFHKFIKTIALK
jgi:uncharacterized membrane protein YqjE